MDGAYVSPPSSVAIGKSRLDGRTDSGASDRRNRCRPKCARFQSPGQGNRAQLLPRPPEVYRCSLSTQGAAAATRSVRFANAIRTPRGRSYSAALHYIACGVFARVQLDYRDGAYRQKFVLAVASGQSTGVHRLTARANASTVRSEKSAQQNAAVKQGAGPLAFGSPACKCHLRGPIHGARCDVEHQFRQQRELCFHLAFFESVIIASCVGGCRVGMKHFARATLRLVSFCRDTVSAEELFVSVGDLE